MDDDELARLKHLASSSKRGRRTNRCRRNRFSKANLSELETQRVADGSVIQANGELKGEKRSAGGIGPEEGVNGFRWIGVRRCVMN